MAKKPDTPCAGGCGTMLWTGTTSSPEPVCQPCRRKARQRVCEQCVKPFERRSVPGMPDPRFCTQKCWGDYQRIHEDPRTPAKVADRARRLRHAETWDGVEDPQIYERDAWECQIPGCGLGPIRRDLAYPESLSASMDHIVPISLGGADVAPNKRAAHLFCNLSRSNRMHPDDVQIVTPELAPLGLLPGQPRVRNPGPVCAVCEMERVRRAGATCPLCRKAAAAERQEKALAMRERGFSWAEIAVELGLSGPGAARNVAYPPWDRYKEGDAS